MTSVGKNDMQVNGKEVLAHLQIENGRLILTLKSCSAFNANSSSGDFQLVDEQIESVLEVNGLRKLHLQLSPDANNPDSSCILHFSVP